MEFVDRQAASPGRYMVTPEVGQGYYVYLTRADDPVELGTPLNAATFNAMQKEFAPAIESSTHSGCYYRTVDGATEWLNPPMELGVEYRTTERYMGKPVYTKLVDCGALPNADTKMVLFSGKSSTPLTVSLLMSNGRVMESGYGYNRDVSTEYGINLSSTKFNVVIYTEGNFSSLTAYALVKYAID